MKKLISRRSLLAATGASALTLPLLNGRTTYAADPAFPKRIMFAVTSNGTIEKEFWPSGQGADFQLGEICSPLENFKSKLLFPRGLDLTVWAQDNPFGGNGDAHHNYGSILTGTQIATGDPPHDPGGPGLALASSKSLDVHLGEIIGTKTVLNEFVAFADLATRKADFSERSFTILTYALAGFANFSSIAIQMAVIGNLAPNQKANVARLGLKALLAGSLANLMSAALAGLILA